VVRLPRPPTPWVQTIDAPPDEGAVAVAWRRVLGYAAWGDPNGRLVLWHHGTPGARRQVPLVARRAADRLGIHLVSVERPGVGTSTDHRYASIREWATDAAAVADHFGHEELAVVGLSGGGPYALACAHELPDRVKAVGLLGSVCPVVGPDTVPEASIVDLAVRFQWLLEPLRCAVRPGLWLLVQPFMPVTHWILELYASRMPEGDRVVFADPEIEAVLIDDIVNASRTQFGAVTHDVALFGRDWGFSIGDIDVPVFWWHGDADNIVPLTHAEHSTELLHACELDVRPGESHLGGFAVADVVLTTLLAAWGTASD
jgi:pimeloyl-ACP methyl ester carboxylesterase